MKPQSQKKSKATRSARPVATPETTLPVLPPSDFDPARIAQWPLTLAGVRAAWETVVTPIQVALRPLRTSTKAVAASYLSTAGGIAESKKKKIDESGLLTPTEDEPSETAQRLDPQFLKMARAVLEAASRAGHVRLCPGHPSGDGVVCFNCHAPSAWPGSPERLADDVKESQLAEWATSALECIVLLLDAVAEGQPKNAASWAQSAAIATDKLLEGTKRHVASRVYERTVRHQFMRLAYVVKDETPGAVAAWLVQGGVGETEVMHSVAAVALAIEARRLPTKDLHAGTMAAVSLVLRPPRQLQRSA